jgi:aromatic-amino-acid transaminase
VDNYFYYDPATHGLNFQGMLASLNALPVNTIVVLHACCHNPTGMDLSMEQWHQVVDVCKEGKLVPFLDMAYQGFAEGVEKDARVVRLFAKSGLSLLVSNSFSKSFSLYGERVGALSLVTQDRKEAERVLSQVKRIIRTNYSNPPSHGAAIVSTILTNAELRTRWETELNQMRHRIQHMRNEMVTKLNPFKTGFDFSFINQQKGMFSYTGLSAGQAGELKEKHSIYILPTGRICIAALNNGNIDIVISAIKEILETTK